MPAVVALGLQQGKKLKFFVILITCYHCHRKLSYVPHKSENGFQGDAGYQDVIECSSALAKVN